MATDQGFVTPEAVPLDLAEATVGSRGIALLIDWVLQATALVVLSLAAQWAIEVPGLPTWVPTTVILVLSFLVFFGYPIAFETVWSGGGRTPGKAALGLRVVTVEGGPVRFRHAAIRAALGLVDFWMTFGLAAVLSSLLSHHNQRLGDFVAGTMVLRERTGAGETAAQRFEVPPAAAAIAGGLDTSGLRPRDYAAVRAFLMRADSLPEGRRREVAQQLLDAVAPRVGAATGNGLPPDIVLQAIAARYQQRAGVR